MSQKIETSTSTTADLFKTIIAIAIAGGSIFGYYYFESAHPVLRVLGVLIGIILGVLVFYYTEKGRGSSKYLDQTRKEVRQVIWPKRQETLQMTLIVFVVVIIMGIFLWLVDSFFLWAVQLLTGQGG